MPTPRSRQFVSRAVLAMAGVMLLFGWYVGSYVGLGWLVGHRAVSAATADKCDRTIYAPLVLWFEHDLPGTDDLTGLRNRAYWAGRGAPDPLTTPWGARDEIVL